MRVHVQRVVDWRKKVLQCDTPLGPLAVVWEREPLPADGEHDVELGDILTSTVVGGFGGAATRGVQVRIAGARPTADLPAPPTTTVAPNTARALHASDLVESPLRTATKNKTSAQNAYRHFSDHGADFPDIQNSVEYVGKAQNFLRTPPGGTLTRVRANGDVVRWHPNSNTFGVIDAGGAPRTFFRPDPSVHGYANNWDYFYAQ